MKIINTPVFYWHCFGKNSHLNPPSQFPTILKKKKKSYKGIILIIRISLIKILYLKKNTCASLHTLK